MGPLSRHAKHRIRTIDIAPMAAQGLLVFIGTLGVVLSSCAPVTTSPLKSSFAPRKSPIAPLIAVATCPVVFLPVSEAASLESQPGYSTLIGLNQVSAFRTGGEIELINASAPMPWNDCVVAYRPDLLSPTCPLSSLAEGYALLALTRETSPNVTTARFVRAEAPSQAVPHCAFEASEKILVNHNVNPNASNNPHPQ